VAPRARFGDRLVDRVDVAGVEGAQVAGDFAHRPAARLRAPGELRVRQAVQQLRRLASHRIELPPESGQIGRRIRNGRALHGSSPDGGFGCASGG
jgi:hypothetical protein